MTRFDITDAQNAMMACTISGVIVFKENLYQIYKIAEKSSKASDIPSENDTIAGIKHTTRKVRSP